MLLDGKELAGYIKERQAKQVRRLRAEKLIPKLAIVLVGDDLPSKTYTNLKKRYGEDIGVEVDIHKTDADEVSGLIKELNTNKSVQGIIVQLPLPKTLNTQEILDSVEPTKDVDGLGSNTEFTPATPTSILWLLSGYNIDLKDKTISILGRGRLVGEPLYEILRRTHKKVTAYDKTTENITEVIRSSDVIITATGQSKLIQVGMVKPDTVIVDASTSAEDGKLLGDVDPELYKQIDLKISPVPGGVGPLTVCALFDNLINSALLNVKVE